MKPTLSLGTALVALAVFMGADAIADDPAWWSTRSLIDSSRQADDFAAINQGQLKRVAQAAFLEMEERLPGGAGEMVTSMVESWQTPTATTDDFAVVTAGQLKAVAKCFYDRLADVGLPIDYPWTAGGTDDDDNYALANIGMAKQVFAFDIAATFPLIMEAQDLEQTVTIGQIASSAIEVRLLRGGQPAEGIEVAFEVLSSGGQVFPYGQPEGNLAVSVNVQSDGSGLSRCGFKAPETPSLCWVRASVAEGASKSFLVMVAGADEVIDDEPEPPPPAGFDGDGIAESDEARFGLDPAEADDAASATAQLFLPDSLGRLTGVVRKSPHEYGMDDEANILSIQH